MLPHAFSHAGTAYDVAFTRMDSQWFATVSRSDDSSRWPLPAYGTDAVRPYSDAAVRAGYIALAEWLVRSADWPHAPMPGLPQQPVRAPVDREKTAPRLDRPSQELIGRELQAMYADLLDQPVPDGLLSLLDAGGPSTPHPPRGA